MKGEGVPENEIEQDAFSLPGFDYLSGTSVALLLNLLVLCSSAFPQKTPSDVFTCPPGRKPLNEAGVPLLPLVLRSGCNFAFEPGMIFHSCISVVY